MNNFMVLEADVLVDHSVSAAAERDLVAALAGAGVTAHSKVVPARRGVEPLHWLVLVVIPLQAFLQAVGEAAAAEAWAGVKGAVRRLSGRQAPAGGRPVLLQDPGTGLQIILPPDLSEDGYRRLTELDLTAFTRGPVRFDRERSEWISDLDEARGDEVADPE